MNDLAGWFTVACWVFYTGALALSQKAGDEDRRSGRLLWACTIGALVTGGILAAAGIGAVDGGTWRMAGVATVWLGLALGEWSRRTLGEHYHPTVATVSAQAVVTSGPYRWIRHPIYLARILSMAGIGMLMGSWAAALLCIAVPAFGFVVRIRIEEAAMAAATGGQYERYRRSTKKLLPYLW